MYVFFGWNFHLQCYTMIAASKANVGEQDRTDQGSLPAHPSLQQHETVRRKYYLPRRKGGNGNFIVRNEVIGRYYM